MNSKRAEEILRAEAEIDVYINGEPIWLEAVDHERESAVVRRLHGPQVKETVKLSALIEGSALSDQEQWQQVIDPGF